MATFEITAPDGGVYHVDAPEGATEQDALAHLQKNLSPASAPADTGLGATAADVAKSAAIGVPKGIIGMAGMPGDVGNLLGRVVQKAASYFNPEITPEKYQDMQKQFWDQMNSPESGFFGAQAGAAPPLTSSDIQHQVEKATGPLYEPKTTPGQIFQTIAEFAPAAMAGPGGVVGKLAKSAVAPGVGSEALGRVFEGSPYEGAARFAGAVLGGGAGIGADRGINAAKNYSAARGAAEDIGNVNAGAVNRMAKSYAADNLTPEVVEQRAQSLGPEAMMLDMGRQMQGRAEAIASQPGAGQNTVLDAVQKRVHGVDGNGLINEQFGQETANRVGKTLDTEMGPAVNKVGLINGISDIVDRVSKPLYQSVMDAHPVVDVPASITERPAVSSAMKNATTLAKQYGEKLENPAETKTILSGDGYHIADDVAQPAQTSLRYWDYVKKDMDRRINAYMKSGGTSELNSADKADLSGLLSAKNALVNHLDTVTNGAYADARKSWAFKPALTDAYDFGFDAFNNNKILPEEFADHLSGMSRPEQVIAKEGYRRAVDNIIDSARNDGAAARRALDTNNNLNKIELLFGPDARQAIENRVAAETRFQDASNKVAANSRTAVRGELVKDTASPSEGAPPVATILGYAHKAGQRGLQYFHDQGMEGTRSAIGQMSTMQGPQLTNLSQVLSRYNAIKATNTSPLRPQISTLAKTLMLGPSTGSSVQQSP